MQFKRLFSPIQLGVIRIYPDNPIIYHQQIPSFKKKINRSFHLFST